MPLAPVESVLPQEFQQIGQTPIDPDAVLPPAVGSGEFAGTRASAEAPAGDPGHTIMSSIRSDNTIGSLVAHMNDLAGTTNDRTPGYDPWSEIRGTRYEDHWQAFVDSGNSARTQAIMRGIDREMEDRRTMAASGVGGFIVGLVTSVLDPTILVPVGGELKLGAQGGYRLGRSAISMAGAAAAGTAVQEAALHATQEERTLGESGLAIGGSVVLGGLLGAGAAGLLNRAERAAAETAIQRIMTATTPGGGGAAAVSDATLRDLTVAGRTADFIARWTSWAPNLRANFRAAVGARQVAQELAENTLYQTMHAEGRTLGAAAETNARVAANARMAQGLQQHNSIHAELRRAGGNMSKEDFDREVGNAMRNADEHPNPYVQRAAQAWREQVFDPFRDEAIRLGLLPSDVSVSTARSYFTRVWNQNRLMAHEAGFKQKVAAYFAGIIEESHRNALARLGHRKAAMTAEIADLRLTAEERGRTLADLEAQGNALDAANPDHVIRVSDINAARQRQRIAKEAGDRAGEQAAREDVKRITDEGGDGLRDYLKQRTALRSRYRRVDLNYAGLQARADQIAQSLADIDERNVRTLHRMATRGRELERNLDKLNPEKFEAHLSGLRSEFNRLIEAQNRAEDRLAQLQATAPDAPLTKAAFAREAQLKPQRMQRLAALSDQIENMETLSRAWRNSMEPMAPEEIAAEIARLNDAIEAEARRASNVTLARGEKAQRLQERLSRLDPKRVDERIAGLEAAMRKMDVEHTERWQTKIEERADGSLNYDAAARDIADEVFDKLTGRAGIDGASLPEYLTPITRGPLKDRTFNIPDALVREFLEDNVREVASRYTRAMAAETELTRRFGRADMRDQITAIKDEYRLLRENVANAATDADARAILGQQSGLADRLLAEGLRRPTKERILQFLKADEEGALEDIQAMRDLVRGTYKASENASNYGRVSRALMHFNYLRSMGGAVLANITEIFRPAMVHGFVPYFRDGVGALMRNVGAVKLSIKEAQLSGQVLERVLQHRLLSIAEVGDPYAHGNAFERFLQNSTNLASRFNGLIYWTDMMKSMSAILSQNRILEGALGRGDQRFLAYLGIDQNMARRIATEFEAHGKVQDGVHIAGTENWADEGAVRAYRAAVSKDVDSIIVTRSVGDIPLFANTPTGRLILQFRNYTFAAHSRVMLRGLQEDKARFLSGMIAMTGVGMLAATLRAWRGGHDRFEQFSQAASNPGFLVGEGLDMAGIFPMMMELSNEAEKVSQASGARGPGGAFSFNPIKSPLLAAGRLVNPNASMQGSSVRFANRGVLGAVFGPTAGLADTAARAAGAPVSVAMGDDLTRSQQNAAISLIPFGSYAPVKEVLQMLTGDSPYLDHQQ